MSPPDNRQPGPERPGPPPQRVSVHGGHSGQFCNHAEDRLADVVEAYRAKGFSWVGLTEHMPPAGDDFLYPEERAAGLDAAAISRRFARYMETARELQRRVAPEMDVLVAFETEDCTGSTAQVRALRARYEPDYVVGSVHHLYDIPFDYSPGAYREAVGAAGGMEGLYCAYFDRQYEMIDALRPEVVGHLDLVRLYDPDYPRHLALPAVMRRVERNLQRIGELGLILDFNLRALYKGAQEPYVSRPILVRAREMGIAVVPGDDSHGVSTVGACLDAGTRLLGEMGFDTRWRRPDAGRKEGASNIERPTSNKECPPFKPG